MTAQTIETPTRATSWTMPAGLTESERLAYRKGYDKAARAYIRKYGAPTVVNVKPWREQTPAEHAMTGRALSGTMVAHHEERHPAAHKGGMSAVRTWVRKYDADPTTRLAEILDPAAPVKRATTRKPRTTTTPVHDELRAGIDSGRVVLVSVATPDPEPAAVDLGVSPTDVATLIGAAHKLDTMPEDWTAARAARKSTRRELAAALRTAGLDPRGDAWTAATAAAGLSPLVSA